MVGVDEFPFGAFLPIFRGELAVTFREGKVHVQAMLVYDKRGMNVSRWWFHCFPKKLSKMTSLRRVFFLSFKQVARNRLKQRFFSGA